MELNNPRRLRYLHFCIPDHDVLPDLDLMSLIDELRHLLAAGEVLYLHCFGGHGRTGTVACALLQAVLGKRHKTPWKL